MQTPSHEDPRTLARSHNKAMTYESTGDINLARILLTAISRDSRQDRLPETRQPTVPTRCHHHGRNTAAALLSSFPALFRGIEFTTILFEN